MKRYDIRIPVTGGIEPSDEGGWVLWGDVERLESSHKELLKALKELYYMVQGECPSLLDEDSGGSGYLDIEISNAIANAEKEK